MHSNGFKRHAGVSIPVICGAMYPCSNPELVAAVSEAGGLGIVQPLSLVYVYRYDLRQGLRKIKALTAKPFGMNLIIEKSARIYEQRMRQWLSIALEEGCRFFITALGNPAWVVREVQGAGGIVYHDVTEKKWALKALDAGVSGLICVNARAGGHAGKSDPEQLLSDLKGLAVPLICAGGVGDESQFIHALRLGYEGVQMGTRFIATPECASHPSYKDAIVQADENNIILTTRVTGVPLSVIETPYLKQIGPEVSALGRLLLRHPKTKHWARMFYSVQSLWRLKHASLKGASTKDFWQAGKSVSGIHAIEPVRIILDRFVRAAADAGIQL